MNTNHDPAFINLWRRDFVSVKTTLHSLRRSYENTRYRTDKIEWEAECVERALAALLEAEPQNPPAKRGPKGGRAPCP